MSESAEAPRPSGLRLGSVAGIPVVARLGSLVAVALIAALVGPDFAARLPGAGAGQIIAMAVATGLLIYLSVFIHELGHALTALRLGMRVRQISLTLVGGASELAEEAPTARKEFLVSAAGPAMSLTLGVVAGAAAWAVESGTVAAVLLVQLAGANLLLGVFNLLPGLPLDGGHLVRAAVWGVSGRAALGLRVAGWAGRVVALGIVAVPLAVGLAGRSLDWTSFAWLGLIAAFMWGGASNALRVAALQERLPAVTARGLARRAVPVLAEVPLAEALRRLREAGAGAIVVVDRLDRPVGIVAEEAVVATPPERRPWIAVGDLARRVEPGAVIPLELEGRPLLDAIGALGAAADRLVVEADGKVYGVLAAEDVHRALLA